MLQPFVLRQAQQADFKLIVSDAEFVEVVEMSGFNL